MILKFSPLVAVVTALLFSVPTIAAEPTATTAIANTDTSPEQVSTLDAGAKTPNSVPAPNTVNPSAQPVPQQQTENVVSTKPDAAAPVQTAVTPSAENATNQATVADPGKTPAPSPYTTEASVASAPAPAPEQASSSALPFTPEQEGRIAEVAKEYLLAHPEILLEVSHKLQAQQREHQLKAMATAVIEHQDTLLNDKSNPSYGPADAKVAVVEFFDYQCSACARQAPVLGALMKANPQARYVFKEWPILSARWESSMTAAATGLQIWTQKGANAYLLYHDAIFATGHTEGTLTLQDIRKAAAHVGKLSGKISSMVDTLEQTNALAQNLGIQATPGVIVMPVSGANIDNVTVIPGEASLEMLQAAINKASE